MVCADSQNRLSTESRDSLGVIIREAKRMAHLIEDLLAFARFGRAELRKQPVDLTQLTQHIIADFSPQLQNRNVVWKVGALGEVFGDPNLLQNAFTNLVDNALKYTKRCQEARITIDQLPQNSSKHEEVCSCRTTVADSI